MSLTRYAAVTDELLSAYIDDVVTEAERALVEAALREDKTIAWRLESLRQTVQLLQTLPLMALPRSFTLSDWQVAGANSPENPVTLLPVSTRAARLRSANSATRTVESWWARTWQSWSGFWQGGNLLLRNAATLSLALFLFLFGGRQFVSPTFAPSGQVLPVNTSVENTAVAPRQAQILPTTEAAVMAAPAAAAAPPSQPAQSVQEPAPAEGIAASEAQQAKGAAAMPANEAADGGASSRAGVPTPPATQGAEQAGGGSGLDAMAESAAASAAALPADTSTFTSALSTNLQSTNLQLTPTIALTSMLVSPLLISVPQMVAQVAPTEATVPNTPATTATAMLSVSLSVTSTVDQSKVEAPPLEPPALADRFGQLWRISQWISAGITLLLVAFWLRSRVVAA